MPDAYTEDQLFEQPAIGLFAELGLQAMPQIQNLRRTRDMLLALHRPAFLAGGTPSTGLGWNDLAASLDFGGLRRLVYASIEAKKHSRDSWLL